MEELLRQRKELQVKIDAEKESGAQEASKLIAAKMDEAKKCLEEAADIAETFGIDNISFELTDGNKFERNWGSWTAWLPSSAQC